MKHIFEQILNRRADSLAMRVEPFIPSEGDVLDIGSGTGHNALAISVRNKCSVAQVDVVDMSVTGPPPTIFDGRTLCYLDREFEAGLMLFILHYVADPEALLREARRVVRQRLIVIQSTYRGELSLAALRCREWIEGRFAFQIARYASLIPPCACSLHPKEYMDREKLIRLFGQSGWKIQHLDPEPWPMMNLSRDLYVLE